MKLYSVNRYGKWSQVKSKVDYLGEMVELAKDVVFTEAEWPFVRSFDERVLDQMKLVLISSFQRDAIPHSLQKLLSLHVPNAGII